MSGAKCLVDYHKKCGKLAVGKIVEGWTIPVCEYHAEIAKANGFGVEYYTPEKIAKNRARIGI
jgi:hypothetical protein